MVHRLLLAAAASVAAAMILAGPPLHAQVVTVDEGSFTITREGAPAGREDFSIRSTPGIGGTIYKAQATVTLDGRRVAPALSTDPGGAPLSYQVEVRTGGQTERLTGQVSRGRVSVHQQGPGGASAKEYVIADGALILDDDVFHQYYFVARRAPGPASIPVLVPRRGVQVAMRLVSRGEESVTIGRRSLPATHLVLTDPGTGDRDIWVDAAGRVLKVALPGRSLIAVRDEPPR
ncbi:MAG: hypothetical protein ACYC2G_04490 [Gemmatimonadaceae bacterium]